MFRLVVLSLCFVAATAFTQGWPNVKWIDGRFVARSSSSRNEGHMPDSPVLPGELPYHVTIFRDRAQICEGALISNIAVVTAASCVQNSHVLEISLGGEMIGVETVEVAPGCHGDEVCPAIIKMQRHVKLSKLVQPVQLPKGQRIMNMKDHTFMLSGRGKSGELRVADVTMLRNADCSNIADLCTVSSGGTVAPCIGNAGAPVSLKLGDGTPTTLMAIGTDSNNDCSSGPRPLIDLHPYLTWLQTVSTYLS